MHELTSPADRFAAWRVAFGAYLSFYLAWNLRFATEVYSRAGVFPDARVLSPIAALPATVLSLASPTVVLALFILSLGAALLFTAGTCRRSSALALWIGLTVILALDPEAGHSPELYFVRWLLLASALFAADGVPPRLLYRGAWLVVTVGYFWAAWTKWFSVDPAWRDGTAMYYVLNTDSARRLWYGGAFAGLPMWLFLPLTWGALAVEGGGIFCLTWRRARRAWNFTAGLSHLLFVFLLDLDQVSVGMVLVHAFLWAGD